MRRRPEAILALAATLLVSRPSAASMFGEENVHLATLVGLNIQELADIATLIAHVKYLLQGVNEVAAGVRQSYRIYQNIRHYSLDDLKRDAKRGLVAAFPDLRDIEREIGLLQANGRAIDDGAFFTHVDRHDSKTYEALSSSYRYGFRSALWPIVYPEAAKLGEEPSEVDLLVHRRLERAGMRKKWAIQNTALGILAKKAQTLAEDADQKGRSDQESAALSAQAAVQTTKNTTTLANHAELQAARKESTDIQIEAFEKKATRAMKESTSVLFDVGCIE